MVNQVGRKKMVNMLNRLGREFARVAKMVKPLSAIKRKIVGARKEQPTNLPISTGRSTILPIYPSGYQCSNVSFCPSINQSTNLATDQSISQYLNLSIYQSINLSINLSNYPPTDLSIYQPSNVWTYRPNYQSINLATYRNNALSIYQSISPVDNEGSPQIR